MAERLMCARSDNNKLGLRSAMPTQPGLSTHQTYPEDQKDVAGVLRTFIGRTSGGGGRTGIVGVNIKNGNSTMQVEEWPTAPPSVPSMASSQRCLT